MIMTMIRSFFQVDPDLQILHSIYNHEKKEKEKKQKETNIKASLTSHHPSN